MPDKFWVNDSGDGLWSTANNWSLLSGGPGGAGVPNMFDTAIFDGAGVAGDTDCSFDVVPFAMIGALRTDATYTRTIAPTAVGTLISMGNADIGGGTFYLPAAMQVTGICTISGNAIIYASGAEAVVWNGGIVWIDNSVLVCYGLGVINITNYAEQPGGPGTPEYHLVNLIAGNNKQHQFPDSGDFLTISGVFGSNAVLATPAVLIPFNPGATWGLNLTGASALGNTVAVWSSDASLGLPVLALGSGDMGGNTNWVFLAPVAPVPVGAQGASVIDTPQLPQICGVADRFEVADELTRVRS